MLVGVRSVKLAPLKKKLREDKRKATMALVKKAGDASGPLATRKLFDAVNAISVTSKNEQGNTYCLSQQLTKILRMSRLLK